MAWPLAAVTSRRSGAAAKPCHRSSSLPAPAGPALGTGAGHSVRPGDGRLGRAGTPSRSIRPRPCELPAPSAAKLPPRCGVPAGVRLLDCIIVYSAVSSTPMTDGRHVLLARSRARGACSHLLHAPARPDLTVIITIVMNACGRRARAGSTDGNRNACTACIRV